jgi:uncharacterized protein (TIGR02391 family)
MRCVLEQTMRILLAWHCYLDKDKDIKTTHYRDHIGISNILIHDVATELCTVMVPASPKCDNIFIFLKRIYFVMAKNTYIAPKPANINIQQKERALPKIDRLIALLENFDADSIQNRSDPKIRVMEEKLSKFVMETFGSDTIEHDQYSDICSLDTENYTTIGEIPLHRIKDNIKNNINLSKAMLVSIKEDFQLDMEDTENNKASRSLKVYKGLTLHPKISTAADDLYASKHYSQAVQEAVKALILHTQHRSSMPHLDGTSLMEHVFSLKSPILKFNSLQNQSELDEQKGYMHLFVGSVMGLRNPRAHSFIQDDPERALEFIAFISLLAKLVDETEISTK